MLDALVVAPFLLAVVLAASGVAKLRDPASVDAAFSDLHVPRVLSAPLIRRLTPWGELALALALLVLPAPLSVVAALGALVLFAFYLVLIVKAFQAPAPVDCNCFGSGAPSTVDGWTVGRNVALVAASVVALADTLHGAAPILRAFEGGNLAWLLAAGLAAFVTFAITHRAPDVAAASAEVASTVDDDVEFLDYVRLPIPFGTLYDRDGNAVQLRQLAQSSAVMLIWVSFGCGGCERIMPEIPGWAADVPAVDVRVLITREADLDRSEDPIFRAMTMLDRDGQCQQMFATAGVPMAVLLGADRLLAGGPVAGADAIRGLIAEMKEQLGEAPDGAASETETDLVESPS